MVGTFYRKPAPDTPDFVEVGSTAGIGDNAVQGMGHFDQIRERSMKTLTNAAGAFQQAAR